MWKDGAGGKLMLSLAIFAMVCFPCLIGYAIYSVCSDVNPDIQVSNGIQYRVDTLSIHGVKHEFVISGNIRYINMGKAHLTHSPECPCLKNRN